MRFFIIALLSAGLGTAVFAADSNIQLKGIVTNSQNQPLADVWVQARTEAGKFETQTNEKGQFAFTDLKPGHYQIVAKTQLAFTQKELNLTQDNTNLKLTLVSDHQENLVVATTREAQDRRQLPYAIGKINSDTLQTVQPRHPSEIMDLISGVRVNITGGEGHMTAIRQPMTTNPVYLYLENGVPTRSTGFFNHNALYEVNVPMAESIEVIKGPGSALHGSDAIAGVIQINSQRPPSHRETSAKIEGGDNGYLRGLFSYGDRIGQNGYLLELNVTESDGWRDATDYTRQAANLQWETTLGATLVRAMVAFSDIDQTTAGSSAISEDDYLHHPEINYTPISLRKVSALRGSVQINTPLGSGELSVIPYFRHNSMDLLANWSLSYDPTLYTTENDSIGTLIKYQFPWPNQAGQTIVGADFDYSPGSRVENRLNVTREGVIYTDYSLSDLVYDYDVTFKGSSAYVHSEWTPVNQLTLQGGLRYDHMGYDYETHLEPIQTGRWRRPENNNLSYEQLSPKFGLTYRATENLVLFGSYRHAFRAPSEGQLFRQGSTDDTIHLDPVKADQVEVGLRSPLGTQTQIEISAYRLIKKDDILTYTDPQTGLRNSVNAGQTSHQGLELDLSTQWKTRWQVRLAASYSQQEYDVWVLNQTTDLSGKEMEAAPDFTSTLVLYYQPDSAGKHRLSAEWKYIDAYWTDAANTHRYAGHDLVNLRWIWNLTDAMRLRVDAANLLDERYAESVSYTAARGSEYAPGMPRNLSIGLDYKWR